MLKLMHFVGKTFLKKSCYKEIMDFLQLWTGWELGTLAGQIGHLTGPKTYDVEKKLNAWVTILSLRLCTIYPRLSIVLSSKSTNVYILGPAQ